MYCYIIIAYNALSDLCLFHSLLTINPPGSPVVALLSASDVLPHLHVWCTANVSLYSSGFLFPLHSSRSSHHQAYGE